MKSKINFTYIIIAVLVVIIFLQRACSSVSTTEEPTVITKYDTVWKKTHDTITKKVQVVKIQYIKPEGSKYTPGESIDTCNARFKVLLKEHSAVRVYSDTIKLDSIGKITIIDTVWLNKLKQRTYIKDYKIPFVTKTVTIIKEQDPKRQLYIGGNLFGDKGTLQLLTPGILYKTKKDQIYQVNVGISFDGTITYGVGMYWKIKLKK
jgi:hypothetical protein